MQILFTLLALTLLVPSVVKAKPPKKPSFEQFSRLVSHSPFTIKPTTQSKAVESPLERDWMLGSISPSGRTEGPVAARYSVTLINKKNRKERIRFVPGFSSGEFQLVNVQQDSQSYKDSRVQIRKGGQTAWIGYDEKLIKVRPSGAGKVPASKKATPARRVSPPIPGRSSNGRSAPRVRRVPRSGR